jgi:hypothetical protein
MHMIMNRTSLSISAKPGSTSRAPLQGALQGEYGTNEAHIFAVNLIWKF